MAPITEFIKHHYRHFNSAALVDAAEAYNKLLADGGKMFVTIAGAMSTAELGLSLAEMIRQDKIHGICCTGANLEEDVFNLVAHNFYERVPGYRDLTPADEAALLALGETSVELISPRGNEGLERFLEKRGPGLHHIAVEVEGIETAIALLEGLGVPMIDHAPRKGARGHKVAFVHPKATGGVLIELVEPDHGG